MIKFGKNEAWKVDFDLKIIYISSKIGNKELLGLINEVSQNEKGLPSGPGTIWKIITIDN